MARAATTARGSKPWPRNEKTTPAAMSEFDEEDPEIAAASAQGGYTNDENDNEGFVSLDAFGGNMDDDRDICDRDYDNDDGDDSDANDDNDCADHEG